MWSRLLAMKHDFSKHFNLQKDIDFSRMPKPTRQDDCSTNYSTSNQREQVEVEGHTSDNNSNTHLLVWEVHWRDNKIGYGLNRRVVCKKATSATFAF